MEIFLLAAVSGLGLNTLYSLKQAAGLEPGSISTALTRLEKLGLLRRSGGEKRGRRVMTLTEEGGRFVTAHWTKCLDPRREVESILRSAAVALAMGDTSIARHFLLEAASDRARLRALNPVNGISVQGGPIEFQARARAVYEFRRRGMEEDFLKELGMGLEGTGKRS